MFFVYLCINLEIKMKRSAGRLFSLHLPVTHSLNSKWPFFYLLFIDPRQSAQDNQKKRVIVTLTSITDTAKGKLLSTHIHTYNTKEKHRPKTKNK